MGKKVEKTKTEQRKKRQINPNSLANLRPSKPGMTNNPNGRPEGSQNVSTCLKQILAQIAPNSIIDSKFVKEFCKENKQATNAMAAAARIVYEGIVKGESWALKEITDRTEGKAPQSVDVTSNGETILATFQIATRPTE